MAEIKRVSIKHEAILDYLIANPAQKLGLVALHFDVSQAWLSTVIHSDAFQAKLKEKSEGVFLGTVVPLREKLLGIAHLGVDKLGEVMENTSPTTDKAFIADTTDTILKNLGFSPKSGPPGAALNQQNNYFLVDKEDLAAARDRMRETQPTLTAPKEPGPPSSREGVTIEASEGTPAKGV